MELLSKIYEVAERMEETVEHAEAAAEAGVYNVPLNKVDGYARGGLPFYQEDEGHSWCLKNGFLPAFPAQEDMPRTENVSFDVFYICYSKQVHRITATRAHAHDKSFPKVSFVNGNIFLMTNGGKRGTKLLLFNKEELHSGAKNSAMPHFWFTLPNDLQVTVKANAYYDINQRLWVSLLKKAPNHYGIYINNCSTINRESLEEGEQRRSCCPRSLWMILAWPIFFIFVMILFFAMPIMSCARKCEVRKYLVQPVLESGQWQQQDLMEIMNPKENSSLL